MGICGGLGQDAQQHLVPQVRAGGQKAGIAHEGPAADAGVGKLDGAGHGPGGPEHHPIGDEALRADLDQVRHHRGGRGDLRPRPHLGTQGQVPGPDVEGGIEGVQQVQGQLPQLPDEPQADIEAAPKGIGPGLHPSDQGPFGHHGQGAHGHHIDRRQQGRDGDVAIARRGPVQLDDHDQARPDGQHRRYRQQEGRHHQASGHQRLAQRTWRRRLRTRGGLPDPAGGGAGPDLPGTQPLPGGKHGQVFQHPVVGEDGVPPDHGHGADEGARPDGHAAQAQHAPLHPGGRQARPFADDGVVGDLHQVGGIDIRQAQLHPLPDPRPQRPVVDAHQRRAR